jgi:hypothetical protein
MIWLRSCPRCHGDLTVESDIYGRYLSCLQCGGEIDEAEIRRLARIWMPFVQSGPAIQKQLTRGVGREADAARSGSP